MVHGEELCGEAAELHLVSGFDFDELCVLDLVLGKLALDKPERHLRAVDRYLPVEILHEIGQRAGMVLVTMCDDDAAQFFSVLKHIRIIGQDEIDARMVVIGKHESCIVEDHIAFAFESRHVLADGEMCIRDRISCVRMCSVSTSFFAHPSVTNATRGDSGAASGEGIMMKRPS